MKAHKLLDGSMESYYWLGILASDGNFSKNKKGELSVINLRVTDKSIVEKFIKFLDTDIKLNVANYNNKKDCYKAAVGDIKTISKLKDLYLIHANKTENPMNINLDGDNLISFLIGFIDGDGCVDTNSAGYYRIRVKSHKNWIKEFLKWNIKLNTLCNSNIPEPKINNYGYIEWNIHSPIVLKFLKKKSKQLPVLKRKWDTLNIKKLNSKIVKLKNQAYIKSKCINLYVQGYKNREISCLLKITTGRVSWYINQFKRQSK